MRLTRPTQVISYTLRDIKDEESYIESMGQARTTEILRDARIGEAECRRCCLVQKCTLLPHMISCVFLIVFCFFLYQYFILSLLPQGT